MLIEPPNPNNIHARHVVVFDVDGTVLGNKGQLRPGFADLYACLTALGFKVMFWSDGWTRSNEMLEDQVIHRKRAPMLDSAREALGLGKDDRIELVVDNDKGWVDACYDMGVRALLVPSWWG